MWFPCIACNLFCHQICLPLTHNTKCFFFIISSFVGALFQLPQELFTLQCTIFSSDFHDIDIGAVSTGRVMGGGGEERCETGFAENLSFALKARPCRSWKETFAPKKKCNVTFLLLLCKVHHLMPALLGGFHIALSPPCWAEFIAQNARSVHTYIDKCALTLVVFSNLPKIKVFYASFVTFVTQN